MATRSIWVVGVDDRDYDSGGYSTLMSFEDEKKAQTLRDSLDEITKSHVARMSKIGHDYNLIANKHGNTTLKRHLASEKRDKLLGEERDRFRDRFMSEMHINGFPRDVSDVEDNVMSFSAEDASFHVNEMFLA